MRNLGTVGKSNLFGVAALSPILQHELQHMANAHDLQDHGAQDDDGDGMRTTSGTVENLFGYITDAHNADSYAFADGPNQPSRFIKYAEYGDNELRARAAEKDSGYDAHSDWAWPGCNTRRVYGPKECEFGFDANGSRVEEEAYGN